MNTTTLKELKETFINKTTRDVIISCLSQVEYLEKFCSWILAISGAIIGLTISNFDKISTKIDINILKIGFWALLLSFLLGLVAKLMIISVITHFKQSKDTLSIADTRAKDFLSSFENLNDDEKELFDEEELNAELLKELLDYFPAFRKKDVKKKFEMERRNPSALSKNESKKLFRAEFYMYLQLISFLLFMGFAVFSIKI